MYQFVRRVVQQYGHTPQLLAQTNLERPIFDAATKVAAPTTGIAAATGPLGVKLEGSTSEPLRPALGARTGITLTEGSYDILVTPKGTGYALYLPNADKLCSVETADQVTTRLTRYASVRELIQLTNPQQRFNVRLRVGASEGKIVFLEGERLDFTLESERDAAVLLVSIDPHGYVELWVRCSYRTAQFSC